MTFDVIPNGRDMITFDSALGRSSVARVGSLFQPCLRARLPCLARNLHRFCYLSRRSPSSECANARRIVCAGDFVALYSVASLPAHTCHASHCGASLSPGFVLAAFTLAPPRTRRAGIFPTVGCRGCLCSEAARLYCCLRSRVIKKKPVRLVVSSYGRFICY